MPDVSSIFLILNLIHSAQPLHLGLALTPVPLAAGLPSTDEAPLLPFLIANLAPATACGLSLPVTLPPLPLLAAAGPTTPTDLGCGSILLLREAASELAGLRGGASGAVKSRGLGGWREARRLVLLAVEEDEIVEGFGAENCAARRGLMGLDDGGPWAARRSRKERREPVFGE